MTRETTTLRELVLHDLGQALTCERALEDALARLTDEAVDRELREVLAEHLEQTRRHAVNVERAFELLHVPAAAEPAAGIEGILREREEFLARRSPSPVVLDMFLSGAAARAEHYELALYEGLAAAAREMGEDEVAELLRRNLDDEEAALARIMQVSARLTAWSLGKEPGIAAKLKHLL